MPAVRAIVRDAAAQDYRFSSLVLGIVKSDAFQKRIVAADTPDRLRSTLPCSSPGCRCPGGPFCKGVGATLALPFLDAMVPALTAAAEGGVGAAPRRVHLLLERHGDRQWTPATTGKGAAYPTILKPFEPHRSSAVVVSGPR